MIREVFDSLCEVRKFLEFNTRRSEMATVVRSKTDNREYVLLGTGFGAYQSKKPNWFFGDLMADTAEGEFAMVCVCDSRGTVGWLESEDVQVVSVDGQPVANIIDRD